jgi:dihydrofolate reductase
LFLKNGWIDEICLSVHPIWLGEGLPLFPQFFEQRDLKLEQTKSYDTGLVQLVYSVINKA